jgi:hypothetical protein
LNDEFKQLKGDWRSAPSNVGFVSQVIDSAEFTAKYPSIPLNHSIPFGVERMKYDILYHDLKDEYHCFNKGVGKDEYRQYGKFTLIDTNGNVIDPKAAYHFKPEEKEVDPFLVFKSILETASEEQLNDADFVKKTLIEIPEDITYLKSSNNTYKPSWRSYLTATPHRVIRLPDDLYLDKGFLLEVLTEVPEVFKFMKHFHNDADICAIAFEQSFHNWNKFPPEIATLYEVRFQQLLEIERLEEEKEREANNLHNSGDNDHGDLPF